MLRIVRWLLVCGVVMVVALAAVLPFAVPPVAERIVERKLAEAGLPAEAEVALGYRWRGGPELHGSARLSVPNTPWTIRTEFGLGLLRSHVEVAMPETRFTESDPLLRDQLAQQPLPAISNLTFSGSVSLDAKAELSWRMPLPVWSAKVRLADVSARMVADGNEIGIDGFSISPGASGIAGHADIAPMFPRINAIAFAGCTATNFFASVRATEKALMVTEATAGFCGGRINLYSVFLDTRSLNAGLTMFFEDIDAGEMLSHLQGFHGKASGRLHGKARLFVRSGGKAIRLSDAYLYSTPGEIGKLQMADPAAITDNLAYAGIDIATRTGVHDALTDLDYSVLKLDLRRGEGKSATLTTRVQGTAVRRDVKVPVDITININGELEQIINTGLGYSERLKGNRK